MESKIYACVDTVSNNTVAIFNAVNDGMAIRDNAQFLGRICPLKDMKLFQVGTYFSDEVKIVPCPSREVDWNSYKLPQTILPNEFALKSKKQVEDEFKKSVADLATK